MENHSFGCLLHNLTVLGKKLSGTFPVQMEYDDNGDESTLYKAALNCEWVGWWECWPFDSLYRLSYCWMSLADEYCDEWTFCPVGLSCEGVGW